MKKLTKNDVTIYVHAIPEEFNPYDEYDKEVADSISQMNNDYGVWGWSSVEVRVKALGFQAAAHLGGCSYKSKKDFIKNSGYYEDMVNEAVDLLNRNMSDTVSMLSDLMTVEDLSFLAAKLNKRII